ncbi:hypothetical protein Ciccas_007826 [Cichlidogyrus casuarinus]|uniref:Phosphatase and actin regulator n=1 Tax=Cichlidogyrus casuarinus TaxID=1844966 RepID=A0ABD2Q1Z5_9PLAT
MFRPGMIKFPIHVGSVSADYVSSDEEEISLKTDPLIQTTEELIAHRKKRKHLWELRTEHLSTFLSRRPSKDDLIARNVFPSMSIEERMRTRQAIEAILDKRLLRRPTWNELKEKNIIHQLSEEKRREQREEMKRMLNRKLSYRPTVEELKERKIIRFNDYVEVTDADHYDRKADKPWTKLTARDKADIRKELNDFKATEMAVHQESRHFTRYHKP